MRAPLDLLPTITVSPPAVTLEDAQDYAEENNLEVYECSSKDGTNVDETFSAIGSALKERMG